MFLLVAIGAIALEALNRIAQPQPVEGGIVMAVAAVGIGINGVTAWLFASGRKGDINIRGALLRMAADAAVSAAVDVSGFAIMRTGWLWLDPVTSLIIVRVILFKTWGLLRDSLAMALDRVPDGIALHEVEDALTGLPGVVRVHGLHIWLISTTDVGLTCHLVMPGGRPEDACLHTTCAMLYDNWPFDNPNRA